MHWRPLTLLFFLHCVHSEWVDPHSMDTTAKARYKNPHPQKGTTLREEHCSTIRHCDSELYLKRIVRLILNNAYLDRDDVLDHFTGHINLHLSRKEYEFLLSFSQDGESREDVFSEVGSIFEVALAKPSLERYKEVIFTIEEQIYFLVFNPTTGALAASFCLLYIIYKLLRAQFTWWSIFKYLLFVMYVVDFIATYLDIRKEEEVNNVVAMKRLGVLPPECDPQKMTWWSYIKTQFESTFFVHPCKAYYDTVAQSELKYWVAPTKILTRQFRTILVGPAGDVGEAFGRFGRQMFTTLPWGLNVAIFPIMLVSSMLVIFMVLLFVTRPRFKISLFHFFTLEIGDSSRLEARTEPRQIVGTHGREVGYNVQHRALVEEASNEGASSDGHEEESGLRSVKEEDQNAEACDKGDNCADVANLGPNCEGVKS